MPSVFPFTPRVIYENNPLDQVICQFRFPTILKIDATSPADYQDSIRDGYPILQEKSISHLPSDIPPEVVQLVAKELAVPRAFDFISKDGKWTIGLTKDFLSLSTSEYVQWEQFLERLTKAHDEFVRAYRPAFYSRIGLRYLNVIRPKKLGLSDMKWAALIKPHLLGELREENTAELVRETFRMVLIDLGNEAFVRLRHGLSKEEATDDVAFVIDADFFTEVRTEVSDGVSRLQSFHQESGQLFRSCISDTLHNAMRPQSVA